METVNIHEAKTQLSKLLERVRQGMPFIIAKAGRPIAKVTAIEAADAPAQRRLGFLAGEIDVPDDFDRMGETDIEQAFGGGHDSAA